jgi:hypothetical protein
MGAGCERGLADLGDGEEKAMTDAELREHRKRIRDFVAGREFADGNAIVFDARALLAEVTRLRREVKKLKRRFKPPSICPPSSTPRP